LGDPRVLPGRQQKFDGYGNPQWSIVQSLTLQNLGQIGIGIAVAIEIGQAMR
jgi:hypothetical protein